MASTNGNAKKGFWEEYKGDFKWGAALLLLVILGLSGAYHSDWSRAPLHREDLGRLVDASLLSPDAIPYVDGVERIPEGVAADVLRRGGAVVYADGNAYVPTDAALNAIRRGEPVVADKQDGALIANATLAQRLLGGSPTAEQAARYSAFPASEVRVLQHDPTTLPTRTQAVSFERPLVFHLELLGVLLVAALVGAVMLAMREPPAGRDEEVR